METPDEPLIPEPARLPTITLPELRGIAPGVALLVLATLAAWLLRPYLAVPFFANSYSVVLNYAWAQAILDGVSLLLLYIVPQFVALVMLWTAFVKADRGDRYLWSAAMILSAGIVAWILDSLIFPPQPNPRYFIHVATGTVFANVWIVSGSIAYASAHLAFTRGGYRTVYAAVALVTFVLLYIVPLAAESISWLTALCSLLVSLGIWSIGVYIAERVDFDPYAPDEIDYEFDDVRQEPL